MFFLILCLLQNALWCQVCNSPAMFHSCLIRMMGEVGDAHRRQRAQLMACWWPDCSGPAAHWAVIATAGASGTDSSGTPIAQSWNLPPSTVCPDQPLMMTFVLTDGKTEAWNQPISSSTDLSFLLSPLAHPSIISRLAFSLPVSIFSSVLPHYLFLPGLSLHLIHISVSRAQSTSAFSKKIPSPTLPPFALAFTFIYLDRFHLGGNNPLTGSFIRMTSSNPFLAVG